MPRYTFHIYANTALPYDSATNSFTLAADLDPMQDRYRVEVKDDDAVMNAGGDFNQMAAVYDMNDVFIDSGVITVSQYGALSLPSGGTAYIDRIEVDGVHYGYVSNVPLTPGTTYAYMGGGTFEEDHTYYETNSTACFAPGTRILTALGEVPVERLMPGVRIQTRDNGQQTLRWAGAWSAAVGAGDAAPMAANWPVTLTGDAPLVGNLGRPLVLSAQHRVLLAGPACDLIMGDSEILAPACSIARPRPPWPGTTWHHLLFDRHEVICAEGIWVESLFLGGHVFEEMPPVQALAALAGIGSTAGHLFPARTRVSPREGALIAREMGHPANFHWPGGESRKNRVAGRECSG